jgi:hypothetical protein
VKALFLSCFAMAITLLSSSPYAEQKSVCAADHSSVGNQPPAGHEWKCVDSKGLADGLWLTWYDNGQLMSERQMKQGKEHGRQRSWWPNGQLMMEGVSYEGNRYKGFKYWSITGEPTEIDIKTETVTKKIDDAGKSAATDKSPPALSPAPPAKSTPSTKP